MKEWIFDQLHIHLARLNPTAIICHFCLKYLAMIFQMTVKKTFQELTLHSPTEM